MSTVVSNAPYTIAAVMRAREHHSAGWPRTEIQRLIEQEFGRRPTWVTVAGWVDEEFADRRRKAIRRTNRRYEQRKNGPRPHVRRVSEEWKLERMREMFLRGVSYRAIGQVAAVWWGEELTDEQVKARLDGRRGYTRRRTREAA